MIEKHPLSQRETLATNITEIRSRIAVAAQKSGRPAEAVRLVAVSKTKPLELIKVAYELGIKDFGENRVQEVLAKMDNFQPEEIRWHLIGHLQSNKAGKVAGKFACIHSVDSLALAQILARNAEKAGVQQDILLQVNISGEESKEGMAESEVVSIARQIVTLPSLEVRGLMTVAPLVQEQEEVRPIFRALRQLRERLQQEVPQSTWSELSMGMTGDYRIAIEEGATIVRIGRAIFGERVYKGEMP